MLCNCRLPVILYLGMYLAACGSNMDLQGHQIGEHAPGQWQAKTKCENM